MKNWKTTAAGILFALCTIAENVAKLLTSGTPINWKEIGLSAIVAIGLALAKDFNVTGAAKSGTAAVILFVCFASLGTTGCGGSLNADIQKIQTAQIIVKGEEQVLEGAIQAQIPLLPADKQADAQAKLTAWETKMGQAIIVKDTAIQAALDSSAKTIDFNKLMADVLALIPELMALAQAVSVPEEKIQPARISLQIQQARYK